MATLTRAEVAERALQALGVLAAGQDAVAEDTNRAGEAVDYVHALLRKEGLAPWATSAVPEWAQSAFIHLVAVELVPTFGVSGERLQSLMALADKGRKDLCIQMFGERHQLPVKAYYF